VKSFAVVFEFSDFITLTMFKTAPVAV
jgi:hypothetical protein